VPDIVYCSRLSRSVETASILAAVWRRPIRTVRELKEWAATDGNVPQETYLEWERRCWADFDHHNDEGESLHHATDRILGVLGRIVGDHHGRSAAVAGHAILFALFQASVRRERATEEMKNRIGFGHYAVVESHSGFRITRDFGP